MNQPIETSATLPHLDSRGNAHMVDVTDKCETRREAMAEAWVRMKPETLNLINAGGHPKGDVFAVARVAGIMAAKRTHELIPLCHPLASLPPAASTASPGSRWKPWPPPASPR